MRGRDGPTSVRTVRGAGRVTEDRKCMVSGRLWAVRGRPAPVSGGLADSVSAGHGADPTETPSWPTPRTDFNI